VAIISVSYRTALVSLSCIALLVSACENKRPRTSQKPPADAIDATIAEENGRLTLVLRNKSFKELVLCQKNVYTSCECLDIRKFPDTGSLPPEKVFAEQPAQSARKEITLSDFVELGPGKTVKLPVDLGCIRDGRALGDSVFLSAFFKNVDPFSCSSLNIDKCDKATQDYCRSLHCIPNASLPYWTGEVRTPYLRVNLCASASPRVGAHRRPGVTVVRRSRTHPLKHRVF
jgi:hypothetical protein